MRYRVQWLVTESSRRVLAFCNDKELLKKERLAAKKLKRRIVGAGNTIDSYGDKFQTIPQNDNSKYRVQTKKKESLRRNSISENKCEEDLKEKMRIMLEDIEKVSIIGEDSYFDMKGKLSLKFIYEETFARWSIFEWKIWKDGF